MSDENLKKTPIYRETIYLDKNGIKNRYLENMFN